MRAVWIKLTIAAAVLPLRDEPENSQFERQEPIAGFDSRTSYDRWIRHLHVA